MAKSPATLRRGQFLSRLFSLKQRRHIASRNAFLAARHVFRRTGGNDPAAFITAAGTDVDDPVGCLNNIKVVLYDQHGIAGIDQLVQHAKQFLNVVGVQSGCRLIEDI